MTWLQTESNGKIRMNSCINRERCFTFYLFPVIFTFLLVVFSMAAFVHGSLFLRTACLLAGTWRVPVQRPQEGRWSLLRKPSATLKLNGILRTPSSMHWDLLQLFKYDLWAEPHLHQHGSHILTNMCSHHPSNARCAVGTERPPRTYNYVKENIAVPRNGMGKR